MPSSATGTNPDGSESKMWRILLIEDNDMNRDMLSRRLTRKGYEVLTGTTVREGSRPPRRKSPTSSSWI
jgi:ActR/RegA family two-component response regulator